MMSSNGLTGHPLVLVSWWTTLLTTSCPAPRCWSWVHGWIRRVRRGDCTAGLLFAWFKIIISLLEHSNESGQSSLTSLLKCTCVASPMCKSRFVQIEGLVSTITWGILKGNSAKWLLTIGTSAWEEFVWRGRLGNGEPAWAFCHCLPGWHQTFSLVPHLAWSAIAWMKSALTFYTHYCVVGNKVVKGPRVSVTSPLFVTLDFSRSSIADGLSMQGLSAQGRSCSKGHCGDTIYHDGL